jgi:hypothetical protein
MPDPEGISPEALATPLGKAFQRLFDDETFADTVIDSPEAVVGEYGLDTDDLAALVSDAHALEGEVSGFGQRGFAMATPLLFSGLRSPMRLGFGFSGPLTITYTN